MNELSRRHAQAEARRAQLLDAALAVFADKGLEAATVKDLSAAAGVAQGLLYHYFPSKEALLEAALERHYFLPALLELTEAGRDRPAREVLADVVAGFAAMLDRHRQLVRVMLHEAPTNPRAAERLARARGEGTRALANCLAERVDAGELRPHDCEAVARLLLFSVVGAHLAGTRPGTFVPVLVDTVLNGVVAR